jgi:hypothetical protein
MNKTLDQKINNWFIGSQDFDEGLRILLDHSKRGRLIKTLNSSGNTRTNKYRLYRELLRISNLKNVPCIKLDNIREPRYLSESEMRVELSEWLNAPIQDYDEGLQLLMKYTTKHTLFHYLVKVRSRDNRYSDILIHELKRIHRAGIQHTSRIKKTIIIP